MRTDQVLIGIAVDIVLAITWLGLLRRQRWRLAWLFALYVLVVLICGLFQAVAPGQFFVAWFWMAKQVLYDMLKLGIALELAWRTFRVFPGAAAAALRATLGVLTVTTLAVLAAPTQSSSSEVFLIASGELHPRLLNGTIWLMATTLVIARWYSVPVHPFHTGLLISFASYLMVFGLLLRLEGIYGWAAQPYLNAIDPPAYLLLVCFWAYLAWRQEGAMVRAYTETTRRIELRTASCG